MSIAIDEFQHRLYQTGGENGRPMSCIFVTDPITLTLFASAESVAAELFVCNESVRAGARFNLYNHSILFAATEPSRVSIARSGRRRAGARAGTY